jgi:hypothetical protein
MQRYHLHIRQAGVLVSPDDKGADFESIEAAYLEAFESAQELWPILLGDRRDPRRYSFEITNSAGVVLMEVPFSELLDNCHDAQPRGRPKKPAPVFDKETFRQAVDNAQQITRETAKLTRQLRATRQSVRSLMTFGETLLPKGPEAD